MALVIERKHVTFALKWIKAQEDLITDAYSVEAIDLERFKAEMEKLRQRCQKLERALQDWSGRSTKSTIAVRP